MKEIKLAFNDRNVGRIPESISYSGIYVVFAHDSSKVLHVWELLYIGAAEDVKEGYDSNQHRVEWEKYATDRKMELVIYTAQLGSEYKQIAKDALVYKFQPAMQSEGLDLYSNEEAAIVVEGRLKVAFGSFVQKKSI